MALHDAGLRVQTRFDASNRTAPGLRVRSGAEVFSWSDLLQVELKKGGKERGEERVSRGFD